MKRLSEEHKKKLSIAKTGLIGPMNNKWKGDKVTYSGFHMWLRQCIGIPDHCDLRGLMVAPTMTVKGTPRKLNYFHWSNRTGVYTRNLYNWWQLCDPCHKAYDFFFLAEKSLKGKSAAGLKRLPNILTVQ